MERFKTWLILILLAVVVVSLTMCIRLSHKNTTSGVIPDANINSPISAPILKQYKDKAGVNHVVIDPKANEIMRSEAQRVASPIADKIRRERDSLAAALALKPKQIEGYTAVIMAASQDSVRFMKRTIDSLRRLTYYYKDKYLSLVVRTSSQSDTTLVGNSFDFAYDADLRTVDYWKRRKVLGLPIGLKEYYTDISSSDPRMLIRGVEKFTVQRKMPAFGLRVQAMGAYNFLTEAYSAGLGLRLDIGDFNTSINYLYNIQQQRFVPTLLTRYDLLQFGR